jgi:hypothetical protein
MAVMTNTTKQAPARQMPPPPQAIETGTLPLRATQNGSHTEG